MYPEGGNNPQKPNGFFGFLAGVVTSVAAIAGSFFAYGGVDVLDKRLPLPSTNNGNVEKPESTDDKGKVPTADTGNDQQLLFTEEDAKELIERWLVAKSAIYGPGYNQSIAINYIHSESDLYKGVLDEIERLKSADGYYAYEFSSIDKVWKPLTKEEDPRIKVHIKESRITKEYNRRVKDSAPYNATYIFSKEDGEWKIWDYATSKN